MTNTEITVQEPNPLGLPPPVLPETDAFEREVIPHIPALYRTAVRITHNAQSAEDLVQDTLERAFKSFDRYERGTNIRAWLFKIMSHVSISNYRYRSVRASTTSLDHMEEWSMYAQVLNAGIDPQEVETQVLARLGESAVHDAMAQLPHNLRLAVMLADVEGFTYKEIAEILVIPMGTVMSRLHRGRRALQRALWDQAESIGLVQAQV